MPKTVAMKRNQVSEKHILDGIGKKRRGVSSKETPSIDTLTLTAGEQIEANMLVCLRADGNCYKTTFTEIGDTENVVGFASESAEAEEQVAVLTGGRLLIPGASFTAGAAVYWNGSAISSVASTSAFFPVGTAETTDSIIVSIGVCWYRNVG
jgi:hypothetical protein